MVGIKKKRKKYLVDKKFQTRLVVFIVILVVSSVVLSGLLSFAVAHHLESKNTRKIYGTRIENQDEFVLVERLMILRPIILRYLLISGVLSMILASISIFYYSHRLAGPIYRLEKHLRAMIDGNYGRQLHFRKNDEFTQLADVINQLQDKLKEKENS
jgi:signal transduction histidine kinase